MDAYKTPESNLELPAQALFKPVKALVYGFLISVVLLLVVSALELFVFALMNREHIASLANEGEINAFFSQHILFLVVDIIVSFAVLYFAGTVIRKYAVGYELKFGFVLALLTLGVHLVLFNVNDASDNYPFWYNAAGLISIFAAILLGARAKK
ncbi:hypothetical protein [Cellvibrio sp. OA-2007]|uniref:hypothetical protein n=1 Tax=Cellvibrio sp. OA-2007 TaxID=529823 RepID=UPI0007825749|nr:hypothetical protein [Cellvibrio sp. OA-2007]